MKNIFKLLSLALVGSTLFVGCQKEEVGRMTVVFENINSPKSYIYDLYNCWEKEESLFINGTEKPVIVSNNTGTVSYVENVKSTTFGTNLYCFYGGYNNYSSYNASSHTYTFTVPYEMTYATAGTGQQKTDSPVVGHTTINSDGTINRLSLKNVGSMLKFSFANGSTTKEVTIKQIQIESTNKYLSGTATVTASSNPSAYTISAPNGAIQHEKQKKLTFDEQGLSIPTTHDNINVYFPIVSLSNAKLQILITATFHGQQILLRSPMFESVSIAQNNIMSLSTITIQGNGNQGEGNNPEVVIDGTTYTHSGADNNNTWRLQVVNN